MRGGTLIRLGGEEETGLVIGELQLAGVAEAEIPAHRVVYVVFETPAQPAEVSMSGERADSAWAQSGEFARYELTPGVGESMLDYTRRKGTALRYTPCRRPGTGHQGYNVTNHFGHDESLPVSG
jgi:hypothetical protein